jgi:DNA-binding IclR family transcriptional regulator
MMSKVSGEPPSENSTSGQKQNQGATPSVPSVERTLRILELLSQSRVGLTLNEIVSATRLPRSSVHTIVLTLERQGYLHRNPATSRYVFGLKLFSLANGALSNLHLREQASPFLHMLVRKTGLTAHMAIFEDREAVLVSKVEPPGIFRLATWVGKRMDVHCTGIGKALIAYIPEQELNRLIRERGLPRHNDDTIGSARKLENDLAATRKRGYSIDDEEDEIGLRCLGAPVFEHSGAVVAAISISGTTAQIHSENIEELAACVKEAAQAVSILLGFDPKTRGSVQLDRCSVQI